MDEWWVVFPSDSTELKYEEVLWKTIAKHWIQVWLDDFHRIRGREVIQRAAGPNDEANVEGNELHA